MRCQCKCVCAVWQRVPQIQGLNPLKSLGRETVSRDGLSVDAVPSPSGYLNVVVYSSRNTVTPNYFATVRPNALGQL